MSVVNPTAPTQLGKYQVRREVGRGGMGVVYEGFDPIIERRVALKTFIHELFDGTQADNPLTRLRREAQAAGRLSHPNIVAVYDYGEEDGTAFIAMEFVEGRSLESYFDARERFALPDIERLMSELLEALAYSHAHGVVHRDIKPANIILIDGGMVKVADFGVARIQSSTLTQVGTVLGSPSYMSPEQFMGQAVDGRSDLYSAGVVLYQLLTAEVPFSGAVTTVMHRALNEEPSPPSALNVLVPRAFDEVIRRAMAKRPDDRYQTAAQFRQAIAEAARAQSQVNALPTGNGTLIRPATAAPAPARPAGPRVLSPLALFSILGVLIAIGAGVYGYFALGMRLPHGASASVDSSTIRQDAPVAAATSSPPAPSAPTSLITAVAVVDPRDPARPQATVAASQMAIDEAHQQLIAKAAAIYVVPDSLGTSDGPMMVKLAQHSDEFITSSPQVVPTTDANGRIVASVSAAVDIRDVQKLLNQISQEQRIDFIHNNGDPRIAVAVSAQTPEEGQPAALTQSIVAENLLKERIHSFGFTVVEDGSPGPVDFRVNGAVQFKRLTARLPASGLKVEKFVITSWTVNAVDVKSGNEIYHNTVIPRQRSWATQEIALQDVGRIIGSEFNKAFFLQYFDFRPRQARLRFSALPPGLWTAVATAVQSSVVVLNSTQSTQAGNDLVMDAQISGGSDPLTSVLSRSLLKKLNDAAGRSCFSPSGKSSSEVAITFDQACNTPEIVGLIAGSAARAPAAPPPIRTPDDAASRKVQI